MHGQSIVLFTKNDEKIGLRQSYHFVGSFHSHEHFESLKTEKDSHLKNAPSVGSKYKHAAYGYFVGHY